MEQQHYISWAYVGLSIDIKLQITQEYVMNQIKHLVVTSNPYSLTKALW